MEMVHEVKVAMASNQILSHGIGRPVYVNSVIKNKIIQLTIEDAHL
jgi:hypothetical protein